MRVTILDDWQDTLRTLPCFALLEGHDVTIHTDHVEDEDILAERLAETEALILNRERTPIRAPLIRRLKKLKLITQRSAIPHIDVDACTEEGIVISTNLHAEGPSWGTVEHTWALILSASRSIPQQMFALREGQWQTAMGTVLRGKTLGIYGYGRVGRAVASYGRAFGMRVRIWAREPSRARAYADGYEIAASREALFSESDVVSMHVRLNADTRGFVTAADLALMKPSAIFINTSRAGIVERGALEAALRAGRPGRAAVDVFEVEPVPNGDDPLLKMDQVVATPHIGYITREDFNGIFTDVFNQFRAFAAGNPIHVVNPEALGQR